MLLKDQQELTKRRKVRGKSMPGAAPAKSEANTSTECTGNVRCKQGMGAEAAGERQVPTP